MSRSCFVILGAGASYDSSSDYSALSVGGPPRPPLVKELFDERFRHILNKYPMARNAAPDIRDAMEERDGAPAVSLEDHLRERYKNSHDELDQRRYLSVLLYLRELLWYVSTPDDLHVDNYDRLLNRLLEGFDHVVFITLNYDALLERALSAIRPIGSVEQFIGDPRWSLIKLHGSVTWGYRIDGVSRTALLNPAPALLEQVDRSEIVFNPSLDPDDLGVGVTENSRFPTFPALSAPLGPDDELICPPAHLEFLKARLTAEGPIDLLVLGYSGYDQSVLRFIREAPAELGSLAVVNSDAVSASEVAARVMDAFGTRLQPRRVQAADDSFSAWVKTAARAYPSWAQSHRAA